MAVQGNIRGIPKNILAEMESWENYQFPREYLIDSTLALAMAKLSASLNRELAVYISRQGRVVYIAAGKDSTVPLAEITNRRGRGLYGLRCIHTHPKGSGTLSQADLAALKKLGLDCILALGINEEGEITNIGLAWGGAKIQEQGVVYAGLKELLKIDFTAMLKELKFEGESLLTEKDKEEAILVGLRRGNEEGALASLEELARLAETAGIKVVKKILQNRAAPSASTYIGKGKAEEIGLLAQALDVDIIIFDDEISPSAQLNLTKIIGRKIIDRTLLILDIFAQRARSNEGKLQVELAQLRYALPRLMGQGLVLSRLGGGIGTRGPGETQLETDRRKIRIRIQELEARQDQVLKTRNLHRQKRQKEELPMVALVGYTNAGKSTLLNALSGAEAHADDMLFATLDALIRRVELPGGQNILITDTVGFIRRLPHHLVTAFRSTLEEVKEADLLLHVVDGSAEDASSQAAAALGVLEDLKALDKPIITVINKGDKIPQGEEFIVPEGERVLVSAKTGQGLEGLLKKIEGLLPQSRYRVELNLPFAQGALLDEIHSGGQVLSEEYTPEGIQIKAKIDKKLLGRLKQEGLI